MASVANPIAAAAAAGTIYLVEEGPNPSTDYFLMPALKGITQPIVRCAWSSPLPSVQALAGATVIFVRYVPSDWKRLVKKAHRSLAELVYFMDDDLWDYRAAAGLSLKYRFKLARYATRHRHWLQTLQATLWVSTKWLANKYASQQPRLVMPALLEADNSVASSTASLTSGVNSVATSSFDLSANASSAATQPIKLFYHGSASHRADISWLYPIIKTVLARNPRLQFEIIGDARTRALYGNLERCTVLAPMKWPAYRTLISTPGRHIGLAPAVPHSFNHARSHTKFFDITVAGAVGIYAAQGPCQGILEHNKHGLLVEMTPDAWVNAILLLAQDPALRQSLSAKALEHAHALSNL